MTTDSAPGVSRAEHFSRAEHLAWAKNRALALLDQGDRAGALASMLSDLGKHDKLRDHPGIELGARLTLAGLMDARELRGWIEGFN